MPGTNSPTASPRQSAVVLVAPALMVLMWGTGFVGTRISLLYGEPLTLVLWRCALTGGIMLAVSLALKAPWPRDGRTIAITMVVGILINGCFVSGSYLAVERGVSAGMVSLIVGLQPLLTAAAAPLLGERVRRLQWLGLFLGLAGVGLVVAHKIGPGGRLFYGTGFAFMSLAGITLGSLMQKRFAAHLDVRTGITIQMAAAIIFLSVLAPFFETMQVELEVGFFLVLFWLSLVVSIGAIALMYVMIRKNAVTRVASLFYLVPPAVAVIEFATFGETLSPAVIIGMAIAAVGVFLVTRERPRGTEIK
ncbi:MAG: DMT family transporter [Rhodospirillales bacterium]|jgi:drug/metabolite transporter (DMT)-like permease|nr:EamA family transporter [Rhodospirillaceae bacterium]MDP6427454.1 DMT family transporter [Rhodospirillales bacterium]MDP6644189.1 DMT family transporter [Rhodospirillales bacterium]MDP6842039.1 DMT family transporter [Rhodospirillales bacterium]